MDYSIGIIGGSDGPTKIYVTSAVNWYTVAGIAIAVIAVAVILVMVIKRRRHM
jgi:Na+-transporting methylmalonyl-CoA/oxaloacetate decarboxylase beta subunit